MLGFRNETATRPFEGVIGEPARLQLTSRRTVEATGADGQKKSGLGVEA